MSNAILIKRNGTNYEVSNGTITVSGSNRADLLAILDSLEGKPASVQEIQAKVKKASEAAVKKAKSKTKKSAEKTSELQSVRDFMRKTKRHVTAAEVAEELGMEKKYAAKCLYHLYVKGFLKSEERGVYFS